MNSLLQGVRPRPARAAEGLAPEGAAPPAPAAEAPLPPAQRGRCVKELLLPTRATLSGGAGPAPRPRPGGQGPLPRKLSRATPSCLAASWRRGVATSNRPLLQFVVALDISATRRAVAVTARRLEPPRPFAAGAVQPPVSPGPLPRRRPWEVRQRAAAEESVGARPWAARLGLRFDVRPMFPPTELDFLLRCNQHSARNPSWKRPPHHVCLVRRPPAGFTAGNWNAGLFSHSRILASSMVELKGGMKNVGVSPKVLIPEAAGHAFYR